MVLLVEGRRKPVLVAVERMRESTVLMERMKRVPAAVAVSIGVLMATPERTRRMTGRRPVAVLLPLPVGVVAAVVR
jgi:regulation of enolase protein 1 (concanavalin A-like superfamily)